MVERRLTIQDEEFRYGKSDISCQVVNKMDKNENQMFNFAAGRAFPVCLDIY